MSNIQNFFILFFFILLHNNCIYQKKHLPLLLLKLKKQMQ